MPHDLLHDVEAVEGCGKVDCRGIFREFGPRGGDLSAFSRSSVLRFLEPLTNSYSCRP